jgi:NADH dehydrogenase FAD-containing subunit
MRVTAIEPDAILLDSERLPTRTVIWTAGMTASPRSLALRAARPAGACARAGGSVCRGQSRHLRRG